MSLTASYSQTASGTRDTARVGLLLPGAQFFIDQNSEVNHLRSRDSILTHTDSLSKIEINNYKEAFDSVYAAQSYTDSIIANQYRVIDTLAVRNSILRDDKNYLENKVKTKNRTILGMAAVLILKAVIIAQSIK